MNRSTLHFAIIILLLAGCETRQRLFQHTVDGKAKPWTSTPVQRTSDDFTFAVVGDLNGGERDHIFSIAVEQLNLLRPDLVLCVGDLIDGGTEETEKLKAQFDFVEERLSKLKAPFFYTVGNHDITNTTMRDYWTTRYGKRYYHFVYNNVLFLVLDSEDYSEKRMQEIYKARAEALHVLDGPHPEDARKLAYNQMKERATGEIGDAQSAYFERVIKEHPHVRWIFLFMHKPVWKREGNGNLDRIEKALEKREYTVINGHVHEYLYTARNDRDYVMIATTGGSQNPLSENAFDHLMLVRMTEEGPTIANIRMDGLLDVTGKLPLGGDSLCFQASRCR